MHSYFNISQCKIQKHINWVYSCVIWQLCYSVTLLCLAQSQIVLLLLCVILWFMFASVLCLNCCGLNLFCVYGLLFEFCCAILLLWLILVVLLYFRCAVLILLFCGLFVCIIALFLYCRLFCCFNLLLHYCVISVHLKTVSFSTLVMLCISVPPQFCEVNLMHLIQTLSVCLSPSLSHFSSPTSSFFCHKLN